MQRSQQDDDPGPQGRLGVSDKTGSPTLETGWEAPERPVESGAALILLLTQLTEFGLRIRSVALKRLIGCDSVKRMSAARQTKQLVGSIYGVTEEKLISGPKMLGEAGNEKANMRGAADDQLPDRSIRWTLDIDLRALPPCAGIVRRPVESLTGDRSIWNRQSGLPT